MENQTTGITKIQFLLGKWSKVKEFITSWDGRCRIPLQNLSARDIIRATNNFASCVCQDAYNVMHPDCLGTRSIVIYKYREHVFHELYTGCIGTCSIVIKKYVHRENVANLAAHDIAMTSQISSHKNSMKLMGHCLEFQYPVLVYDGGGIQLLSNFLDGRPNDGSLSWMDRLRIACNVAYALVYLHKAFSTPVIHRNLNSKDAVIDQFGFAKLLDLSTSISLPPVKFQVEDKICGTTGYGEYQCTRTGIVTEKVDVYHFWGYSP